MNLSACSPSVLANPSTSWTKDGLFYFKSMIGPSTHRFVHLMGNQLMFFLVLSSPVISFEL